MSSGAPWDDPAEDQTALVEHEPAQGTAAPVEPDYAGSEPGEDPAGELECPECGKRFKRAMHRGLHRRKAHGILGSSKKDRAPSRAGARRSRSSSSSTSPGADTGGGTASGGESRRRKAIKDTLFELADLADSLMGRRGLAIDLTLPEIVRRDADRQATAIAGLASRFEPLGVLIDVVFGAGGPLSFLLAFGPTVRKLRQLAGQRQAENEQAQQEAWDQLQQVPAEGLDLSTPGWQG